MKKTQLSVLLLLFGYTLGIHRGYIALWHDSSAAPIRTFSVSAASLPPADRQALEKGIPAEDRQKLLQLLEDYLS